MSIDQFIRGDTKLIGIFGHPVAHSISPLIHNHAFRELGLPYCYIPLAVPPGDIHTAAYLFRSAKFAGANVTIPHKSAITHYCDRLSPLSRATGTVNTLYWDDTTLCGTTTDSEGFVRAVTAAGHQLDGSRMVLLGNGGTARTLAIALTMQKKISSLCIVGRNHGRISALAKVVSEVGGFPVAAETLDSDNLPGVMKLCNLLVNCTSVGMHPNSDATVLPGKFLHKDMTVFDAIYNPAETRLLREAREAGCRTENGLRMLLFQGLASFKYWTGVEVPEELFPPSLLYSLLEKK